MVAFGRKYGKIPKTARAMTGVQTLEGARGVHLYFRHPGSPVRFKEPAGRGVDIQADGRYVVAPSSQHFSGQSYGWDLAPDDVEPADLPLAWLDAITQREPQAQDSVPRTPLMWKQPHWGAT